MSMLDQVHALEEQVLQRLRELRPLVAEYQELEQAAERLGLQRDDHEAIENEGSPRAADEAPRHAEGQAPPARRGGARERRKVRSSRFER